MKMWEILVSEVHFFSSFDIFLKIIKFDDFAKGYPYAFLSKISVFEFETIFVFNLSKQDICKFIRCLQCEMGMELSLSLTDRLLEALRIFGEPIELGCAQKHLISFLDAPHVLLHVCRSGLSVHISVQSFKKLSAKGEEGSTRI